MDGTIKYCAFREIGYYLGVQFAEGQKWTRHKFRPKHMLDPRRLQPRKRTSKNTVA
jgi:hypothetical protein